MFILPTHATKTSTERVIVLNSIAQRVVDSRRHEGGEFVFTYAGRRVTKLNNSGWKRAWRKAGLPVEPTIRRGVQNLRHTFGRRLRAAGLPLETRKALLGHANGDITTHYFAAELEELLKATETIVDRGAMESPNLMLLGVQRTTSDKACRKSVGK